MPLFRPRRIANKIIVLMLAIESASILLLGGLTYSGSRDELLQTIRANLDEAASRTEGSVSHYFDPVRTRVAVTASVLSGLRLGDTRERELFHGILAQRPEIEELSLVGGDGRETLRLSRLHQYGPDALRDLGDDSLVRAALTGEERTGPIEYSDYLEPHVRFALPVAGGYARGASAILVELNLKWLWAVVERLRVGGSGYVYVLSRERQLIAHPDPSWVLKGTRIEPGTVPETLFDQDRRDELTTYTNFQGVEVAGSAVFDPARQWWIVVELPVAEGLAPLDRLIDRFSLALITAFLVTAVAAFLFARMITRPLDQLRTAVTRLAAGERQVRVRVAEGSEIGTLAAAFNLMSQGLDQYISALREQKERALVTLHSIGDAVITTDVVGVVDYMNPVAERLSGWSNEDARSKPLDQVFRVCDATTREPLENPVESVIRGEEPAAPGHDRLLLGRDGNEFLIADNAAPIRDERGAVAGVVLVFRDVTQAHTLQASVSSNERNLAAITNAAQDAIVRVDGRGRILFWNQAAEALFGWAASEALGQEFHELLLPYALRERAVADYRRFGASGSADFLGSPIEGCALKRDGSEFPVEISISAIREGDQWHAVALVRDISERQQAKLALNRQKDLYDALSATNHAIVNMQGPEGLYRDVCQIAVEKGRLAAAWMVLPSRDGSTHQRFALCGIPELPDAIEAAEIAIAEARPVIRLVNAAGQDSARIGATGTFPVHRGGRPVAAFCVCARSSDFFTPELVALLAEMAGDLGFGLDTYDRAQDRERFHRLIVAVAEGVSDETGRPFFDQLVKTLAATLEVDYVLVGELDPDKTEVTTLAVQAHGMAASNFTYALAGTPCADVVDETACIHPESVRQRYPEDRLLVEMGIESYAASPLKGHSGETLGLLVALHGDRLRYPEAVFAVLKTFAGRAAAELLRQRQEAEQRLAATAFETQDAIIICDRNGVIERVNHAFTRITGFSADEAVGNSPRIIKSGLHEAPFYDRMWGQLTTAGSWQGEVWNRRKSGELYPVWQSISAVRDEHDQVSHYVSISTDLSELKRQQEMIERTAQEEQMLSRLLRLSLEPIKLTPYLRQTLELLSGSIPWIRAAGRIALFLTEQEGNGNRLELAAQIGLPEAWSEACAAVELGQGRIGVAASTLSLQYAGFGHPCGDNLPPLEPPTGHYSVPLISNQRVHGVLLLFRPAGMGRATPADEAFLLRVADVVSMGISRRYAEEKIAFQAYHDSLTGLLNRRLLNDRLRQEIAVAERRELQGALLFLDLDHFKNLNDVLGHSFGDNLLRQVAQRLQSLVRTGDTVARLGGDEFVVLLPAISSDRREVAEQAGVVAEKLRQVVGEPYRIDDHDYQLTPSIGIALYPDAGTTPDDVLKHADAAMYRAKADGRNLVRYYQPSMQAAADSRLFLERELRRALERGELALNFQPQFDRQGQTVSAEVLLRWHHSEQGTIAPAQFIPVAEETGLILPIGEWVLRTACGYFARWRELDMLDALSHISINVSPKQFHQLDFVDMVRRVIEQTGADPNRLVLELTEGVLLRNTEDAIHKMRLLREFSVRFSIDDFGTGYSSLAYLKRLPLDELKIDQSFVRDVQKDPLDAAIVETIVSMANHLDLTVIAEGVETHDELEFLRRRGCGGFQGFYFSRPLTPAAFEEFLLHTEEIRG